jgi:hypothetical protein
MGIGDALERSDLTNWSNDELRKQLSSGMDDPVAKFLDRFDEDGNKLAAGERETREVHYTDPSTEWAIKKGYFLEIFHLNSRQSVFFKAFLTDFSDAFSSNWSKESVFGRSDPIQTFQNTQREISVAWDLVSSDLAEAKANLIKANNLIAMLYPSYAGAEASVTSIKSGPLFKVKMGNLICRPGLGEDGGTGNAQFDGLACTMGGFQYSPSIDDGFFDPVPGIFYPQTINIDIVLSILHEDVLGFDAQGESLFPDADQSNSTRPGFPYGGAMPGDVPANADNSKVYPTVRGAIPEYLKDQFAEAALQRAERIKRKAESITKNGTRTANVYNAETEGYGEVVRGIQPGFGSYLELQKDLYSRRAEIQMNEILSPRTRRSTIPKAFKFIKGDIFAFD